MSTWNTSAPTGRIFMNFDTSVFFENVKKFQVSLKFYKKNGTVHQNLCTLIIVYRWIFLGTEVTVEVKIHSSSWDSNPQSPAQSTCRSDPPNIKFPQNPLYSFRDETYGQLDRQAEITCSWSVHCTRFVPRRQNINIITISSPVKTKAYRMWTLCIFLWCDSSKRCSRLAGLLCTGIRKT
jgi:hypothetical protein